MPLSQKQMEYLALAWQCFDTEPKIDYEKFKDVAGLKSTASARELMRVTKNKLKSEYGALSGDMKAANITNGTPSKSGSATPKSGTPKTPGSRKRTAPGGGAKKVPKQEEADDSEADADDVGDETLSKKVKIGNGVKAEPVEDEELDGFADELLFQ